MALRAAVGLATAHLVHAVRRDTIIGRGARCARTRGQCAWRPGRFDLGRMRCLKWYRMVVEPAADAGVGEAKLLVGIAAALAANAVEDVADTRRAFVVVIAGSRRRQ